MDEVSFAWSRFTEWSSGIMRRRSTNQEVMDVFEKQYATLLAQEVVDIQVLSNEFRIADSILQRHFDWLSSRCIPGDPVFEMYGKVTVKTFMQYLIDRESLGVFYTLSGTMCEFA